MAVIAVMAVKAGALELNGLKAGDVAGLAADMRIALPAAAEKAMGESFYFFYTKDQASGAERLKLYVDAMKKVGISVIKAEVVDAGGLTQCNIAYKGPERIFKLEKTFPGAMSMPAARAEFESKRAELARVGAVMIEGGAVLTGDGYGKVSMYSIVYISAR